MTKKRLTLEDLEARYAGFCAAMHGVKDILHGTYEVNGGVKGPEHE